MIEHPPLTMTLSECAEELRCSRAQAYLLASRGVLRTVLVGRRKRVLRSELERLLADGELETAVR